MKVDEKGFTLIEIIVSVAVTAILGVGISMTVAQVYNSSQRSNDWSAVIQQAQNVGYWIRQDALMAQSVNATDNVGTTDVEFATLNWKDWESGETHNIRYILLDSANSLKKVQRKELTWDNNGAEIGNKTTFVADNINTANLSQQNGVWRLSIEAVSGEQSSAKTYLLGYRF